MWGVKNIIVSDQKSIFLIRNFINKLISTDSGRRKNQNRYVGLCNGDFFEIRPSTMVKGKIANSCTCRIRGMMKKETLAVTFSRNFSCWFVIFLAFLLVLTGVLHRFGIAYFIIAAAMLFYEEFSFHYASLEFIDLLREELSDIFADADKYW